MEKIWDDFIKREELEISPGVIDQDLVRALSLNTYLVYIRDMVNDGLNQFPEAVTDQLETVMEMIYESYVYVLEGRRPEPEEISAYKKDPENAEALQNMTRLCVSATEENWPELERQMKELIPDAVLDKINWDSAERRKNAEEWRKRFEKDGYIEL